MNKNPHGVFFHSSALFSSYPSRDFPLIIMLMMSGSTKCKRGLEGSSCEISLNCLLRRSVVPHGESNVNEGSQPVP